MCQWMTVKWKYVARIPVPAGDPVTVTQQCDRLVEQLSFNNCNGGSSLEVPQVILGEAL
jgi:hypothetical protein